MLGYYTKTVVFFSIGEVDRAVTAAMSAVVCDVVSVDGVGAEFCSAAIFIVNDDISPLLVI